MTSEADEGFEHLIDSTRFKLKGKIAVEQVLPYLHFLDQECKDRIKQKSITDGDIAAADLLLSAVIERPHKQGWFWAFIDALAHGGSELAADYLTKPPKPEEEAENDTCVELIRLLAPSLSEMKTTVVCGACYSAELLTDDDKEKVSPFTSGYLGFQVLWSRDVSPVVAVLDFSGDKQRGKQEGGSGTSQKDHKTSTSLVLTIPPSSSGR